MGDAIIEVEDDDFLSQVAAVEIAALSDKRHKTAATTSTNGTTRTTDLSQANTNKEEGAEGTYTAALIGSRSLLFQQQSSSASGQAKGLVAGSSNNNNVNVFANPEFGGGGSTVGGGGVGGGSCFKCGKSGHWARHCDANSYAVVDPSVTEKACPCGLGSCIVRTANTEKNRGRQFYKCPLREENGGCGYFDNMTVRSQSYASNPSIPELSCLCGAGPCLILTAKTEKNIGNMFYRCPANQGSCGFFKWCHDHTIQGGLSAPVNAAKVHKTNEISSNNSCFNCGNDGHWAKDCPARLIQKPTDHRGGNAASSGTCYECGNPGHWAKDCSGLEVTSLLAMGDSIEDQTRRLILTEDEEDAVVVEGPLTKTVEDKARLCLVGKLLTNGPFSVEVMKSTLLSMWKPVKGMQISCLADNLFLYQFNHVADKERVLLNGPWSFDEHLVMLNEFDATLQPSKISLKIATFWIQLHNLPSISMTKEVGQLIGDKIGSLVDIEYGAEGVAFGSCLRIRVAIDVSKPLRRGLMISVHNRGLVWVTFKYERLPIFCYFCGILGHINKECSVKLGQDDGRLKQSLQYGSWLRAELSGTKERAVSPGVRDGDRIDREESSLDANQGREHVQTKILKAKYLHKDSFFNYPEKRISSHVWRGKLKLNTDGCAKGDPGEGGIGGLFRDETGEWICGFYGKLEKCTSLEAELWGVYRGLTIALEKGFMDFTIETDSTMVVGMMKARSILSSPFKSLVDDARHLSIRCRCTIAYILREGNKCADGLAKMGVGQSNLLVLMDDPPMDIKSQVVADMVRLECPRLGNNDAMKLLSWNSRGLGNP